MTVDSPEALQAALAGRPELQARLEAALQEAAQAGNLPVPGDLGVLDQFVRARSWDESRRIVEQHPELLGNETDALLGQLIEAAEQQGDNNARRIFVEHRDLLRRCREAGVSRAFAEKMLPPEALAQAEAAGITPEQALEMARSVEEMPPELREVLAELAATGSEVHSPEDLERVLAERPELRAKLEAAAHARGGVGGAGPDVPPQFRDDLQAAKEAERSYLRTGNGAALDAAAAAWQRILTTQPSLPPTSAFNWRP